MTVRPDWDILVTDGPWTRGLHHITRPGSRNNDKWEDESKVGHRSQSVTTVTYLLPGSPTSLVAMLSNSKIMFEMKKL